MPSEEGYEVGGGAEVEEEGRGGVGGRDEVVGDSGKF